MSRVHPLELDLVMQMQMQMQQKHHHYQYCTTTVLPCKSSTLHTKVPTYSTDAMLYQVPGVRRIVLQGLGYRNKVA